MRDTMRGVALASGASAAPGPHVHHRGDGWELTSHVPAGAEMLDAPVLEKLLAGRLGTYVYPRDVVFHRPDRAVTRWADFLAVEQAERVQDGGRDDVVNHLTVDVVAEAPEEEEEEEEEDSCDEGEEAVEEEWVEESDDDKE